MTVKRSVKKIKTIEEIEKDPKIERKDRGTTERTKALREFSVKGCTPRVSM